MVGGIVKLAILILITLTSCAARNTQKEQLEFWGLGGEGEHVAQMIPEFERRNPNIHVVLQQIPFSAAHEKLVTAYVGESTPDVAQMGNTWIPEFVAMNALDDLGPLVTTGGAIDRSDYFPGIWETNVVDGTLYGIPWYVDTRVLFYRSDILASVGFTHAPRTWTEWLDCMSRIQQQKKARWGLLLPTNEYEPVLILGLSNHATFLNANGTRGAFEQPQFAQAFDFYINLFRRGYAPPVSNSQIANLYQQFGQGEFTMFITGPWNVSELKKRLPPEVQDKWATAALPARDSSEPTGISMAGGSSLVRFRGSKHADAARKLIEFLSDADQQVRFFELSGDLPARRSAWKVPALTSERHFPAFREQLERVTPMPRVPEYEQIATVVSDRQEAVVRGQVRPDVALKQLDQRADELLEKRRWILSEKKP